MPKTYTFILAAALLATACTPTRPTAQARVSLPWSAQQLTDSLKYLLSHVVRMDTAQYHVADGVFSMRPGATVHDLTVMGKLNVLAEPGNGLPDTIHLPDSIPHLPGGGIEIKNAYARFDPPVYLDGLAIAAPFNNVHIYPSRGKVDAKTYRMRFGMRTTTPTKKTKRHAKH